MMNHSNVCADCDTPTYTVIELAGRDLAGERILVRSKLSTGGAIEVDYCEGDGWESTQHLKTDGTVDYLIAMGKALAAEAVGMPVASFRCHAREVA